MNQSPEGRAYTQAAQRAIREVLRRSALLGQSVPVAGPGKGEVIWLTPEQILEELRKQEAAEKALVETL